MRSAKLTDAIVVESHGLNDLFCRLFHALTKSQGMAALVISPAKANTITELLESNFRAINLVSSQQITRRLRTSLPSQLHTSLVSSSNPSLPFRLNVPISVHFVSNPWLAKNWKPS